MSAVRVEVCSCCAIKEKHVADAVARIRAEHGENVEIIERKCLDVCLEAAAVKVEQEVLLVRESDVETFEDKVRAARAK